uniref:C2H2-type domain-containing protein n=1 Tax=Timema poppense TaxID=170557 RepID=A0A7R9CI01_TIMPO|nr:unnamed protein product [Timema poppensis]
MSNGQIDFKMEEFQLIGIVLIQKDVVYEDNSQISLTSLYSNPLPRIPLAETSEARYFCPNCPKSYLHQHNLIKHLRYECGMDPQFQCPYCPQKATQKDDKHLQSQKLHIFNPSPSHIWEDFSTENCFWNCKKCGKVYQWKKNLVRHMRLECGKDPQFQCPYCSRRMIHSSNLKTHIKRAHQHFAEFGNFRLP